MQRCVVSAPRVAVVNVVAVRCSLIRRSARSRSKIKVDVFRDLAFATDESRAEVVCERHLRERVLDKLGVGRHAGFFSSRLPPDLGKRGRRSDGFRLRADQVSVPLPRPHDA